jgi:methyltransferase (TIGR00027 family)
MTAKRRVARRQSDTAEINAAQRAAEALLPRERRLFHDPFARYFVRRPPYRAISSRPAVAKRALQVLDWWAPGLHVHILLRARYADDTLRAAAQEGIDQVILLGAGFDSTSLRHGGRPLTVYEVDSPPTQRSKRDRLDRHGLEPRNRVVYVPCDLERHSPRERLWEAGFPASRPVVIVWLGVSMYLTFEAFERALAELGALSAPGSLLVFDYMDPAVIDGTTEHVGARRLARSVARRGEPYTMGLDPTSIEAMLQEHGFTLRDHARTRSLAERYGGAWARTDEYMGVVTALRTRD